MTPTMNQIVCLYCDQSFEMEPTSSVNCPWCTKVLRFDEKGLFLRYDENRILQTGPWLQLRWSDESFWKDHKKLSGRDFFNRRQVVEVAQADWEVTKAKWHLSYDIQLRIK